MVMLTNPQAQTIFAASQNRGRLKIFGLNKEVVTGEQEKPIPKK